MLIVYSLFIHDNMNPLSIISKYTMCSCQERNLPRQQVVAINQNVTPQVRNHIVGFQNTIKGSDWAPKAFRCTWNEVFAFIQHV